MYHPHSEHPHGQESLFEDFLADTAVVHETSMVDKPCRIGGFTRVMHFSHIMPHSIIGEYCQIGSHVTIPSGVFIGNNVRVMNNVMLASGLIIEDGVYCGVSAVFSESRAIRSNTGPVSRVSPTIVRKGAHLAPNTVVSTGCRVGQYAFVEAGTVVDRHVPDFAVVSGDVMDIKAWRCQCSQELNLTANQAECDYCGKHYYLEQTYQLVEVPSCIHRDTDSA